MSTMLAGLNPAATEPMEDQAPARVGLRLGVALALGAAAAAVVGSTTASVMDASTDMKAAVIIGEVYLCIALALLGLFARTGTDRRGVLNLVAPPAGSLRLGAAAWIGAYIVSAVLYGASALLGASPSAAVDILLGVGADNGRLVNASGWITLLILARVCVLVPVTEELLFRGALFSWLRRRLSAWSTVAVTAVLFGLMHQLPAFIPLATVVGLAAGWIRERTGSSVVPIVMHAVQNVVVVLVSLVVTGWDATLPVG